MNVSRGQKRSLEITLLCNIPKTRPTISIPWRSAFWSCFVPSTIYYLLRKDASQRPAVRSILDILTSYKRILVSPLAEPVFNCVSHMSFSEWIALRDRCANEMQWLYEL